MLKRLPVLPILAVVALLAAPVAVLATVPPVHALTLSAPHSAPDAPASPLAPLAPLVFGMAIPVKDIGTIAKKFVRNAQAAAGDYAEGVKSAGGRWEEAAAAAEDNFGAGVQQAVADKRFSRGVRAAGGGKYSNNASTKGAQRFGPGVAQAEGDFVKGAGPVLDVIRNINLPGRRPAGDPSNMQRSQAIATALRAWKLGR